MELTLVGYLNGIVGNVRNEVSKIPDFEYGVIEVLLSPKCEEAKQFILPDMSLDFEPAFLFSVVPGFSHTRPAGWRGSSEEFDCAADVALKRQACSYVGKHTDGGSSSSQLPNEAITPIRNNTPGSILYQINKRWSFLNQPAMPFLNTYVTVSGANPNENERCAMAPRLFIHRFAQSMNEDQIYYCYYLVNR